MCELQRKGEAKMNQEPIYDNVWSWRKKVESAEIQERNRRGAAVELWLRGDIDSADFEFFADYEIRWMLYASSSVADVYADVVAEIKDKVDLFLRRMHWKESVVAQ